MRTIYGKRCILHGKGKLRADKSPTRKGYPRNGYPISSVKNEFPLVIFIMGGEMKGDFK